MFDLLFNKSGIHQTAFLFVLHKIACTINMSAFQNINTLKVVS